MRSGVAKILAILFFFVSIFASNNAYSYDPVTAILEEYGCIGFLAKNKTDEEADVCTGNIAGMVAVAIAAGIAFSIFAPGPLGAKSGALAGVVSYLIPLYSIAQGYKDDTSICEGDPAEISKVPETTSYGGREYKTSYMSAKPYTIKDIKYIISKYENLEPTNYLIAQRMTKICIKYNPTVGDAQVKWAEEKECPKFGAVGICTYKPYDGSNLICARVNVCPCMPNVNGGVGEDAINFKKDEAGNIELNEDGTAKVEESALGGLDKLFVHCKVVPEISEEDNFEPFPDTSLVADTCNTWKGYAKNQVTFSAGIVQCVQDTMRNVFEKPIFGMIASREIVLTEDQNRKYQSYNSDITFLTQLERDLYSLLYHLGDVESATKYQEVKEKVNKINQKTQLQNHADYTFTVDPFNVNNRLIQAENSSNINKSAGQISNARIAAQNVAEAYISTIQESLAETSGYTAFDSFQGYIAAFVTMISILYIILTFWKSLMGELDLVSELPKRILTLVMIYYFAVGDGWKSYFFDMVFKVSNGSVDLVYKSLILDASEMIGSKCSFGRGYYLVKDENEKCSYPDPASNLNDPFDPQRFIFTTLARGGRDVFSLSSLGVNVINSYLNYNSGSSEITKEILNMIYESSKSFPEAPEKDEFDKKYYASKAGSFIASTVLNHASSILMHQRDLSYKGAKSLEQASNFESDKILAKKILGIAADYAALNGFTVGSIDLATTSPDLAVIKMEMGAVSFVNTLSQLSGMDSFVGEVYDALNVKGATDQDKTWTKNVIKVYLYGSILELLHRAVNDHTKMTNPDGYRLGCTKGPFIPRPQYESVYIPVVYNIVKSVNSLSANSMGLDKKQILGTSNNKLFYEAENILPVWCYNPKNTTDNVKASVVYNPATKRPQIMTCSSGYKMQPGYKVKDLEELGIAVPSIAYTTKEDIVETATNIFDSETQSVEKRLLPAAEDNTQENHIKKKLARLNISDLEMARNVENKERRRYPTIEPFKGVYRDYSYVGLFDMLDCKIADYLFLNDSGSKFGLAGEVNAGTFIAIVLLILVFIYGLFALLMVAKFVQIYLISMCAITLLIYMSPLVFVGKLFADTQSFFEEWKNKLIGYLVGPPIYCFVIGLMIAVFDISLYGPSDTFISKKMFDSYGDVDGLHCWRDDDGTQSTNELLGEIGWVPPMCSLAKLSYAEEHSEKSIFGSYRTTSDTDIFKEAIVGVGIAIFLAVMGMMSISAIEGALSSIGGFGIDSSIAGSPVNDTKMISPGNVADVAKSGVAGIKASAKGIKEKISGGKGKGEKGKSGEGGKSKGGDSQKRPKPVSDAKAK